MHRFGFGNSERNAFCRSELAREEPVSNALIQNARVIVNDHRERARSYRIPAIQNPRITYS